MTPAILLLAASLLWPVALPLAVIALPMAASLAGWLREWAEIKEWIT
jgi:hypothetical protein